MQSLSIEARIHLSANLYMFASPHISRLPSQAVGTYIKFFATLMNSLPVNALDPETASKRRSTQSQSTQNYPDSDSDDGQRVTVVVVSSFDEPPLPKLDARTIKRLSSIPSAAHITSLFSVASKSDSVLLVFVVFLLSLVLVWPSQRDIVLNHVAGLGNGGLIRMLYRQYVLRSQIGLPNINLSGMFKYLISDVSMLISWSRP